MAIVKVKAELLPHFTHVGETYSSYAYAKAFRNVYHPKELYGFLLEYNLSIKNKSFASKSATVDSAFKKDLKGKVLDATLKPVGNSKRWVFGTALSDFSKIQTIVESGKYDPQDFVSTEANLQNIEEDPNAIITLRHLPDGVIDNLFELHPDMHNVKDNKFAGYSYGELATIIKGLYDACVEKKATMLERQEKLVPGDLNEHTILFDFMRYDRGSKREGLNAIDVITEYVQNKSINYEDVSDIYYNAIWIINMREFGRPDATNAYDIHTRLNISLCFARRGPNTGTMNINGVRIPYAIAENKDLSDLICKIDADEEGNIPDPIAKDNVDNWGNILILNRYLGTIARYKTSESGDLNFGAWFDMYASLIASMSLLDLWRYLMEVLRNVYICATNTDMSNLLLKIARTRYCAVYYCHTEIDPTYPVNPVVPRVIPVEPLEVTTDCEYCQSA